MARLNCVAVVDLAAHALPRMVARGSGALVVVSSAAAWQPVPYMATYAATKAFGLHWRALARGSPRAPAGPVARASMLAGRLLPRGLVVRAAALAHRSSGERVDDEREAVVEPADQLQRRVD
jgi:short chain dehydrogenase